MRAVLHPEDRGFSTEVVRLVADTLRRSGVSLLLLTEYADVSDKEKIELVDEFDAEIFVSIGTASSEKKDSARNGYLILSSIGGKDLAHGIVAGFVDKIPLANKRAGDGVEPARGEPLLRRQNKRAAVSVKCGYVTNAFDSKMMDSDSGREQYAAAIAQGVLDYAGRN